MGIKTCCAKDCERSRHSTNSYCEYHAKVQFRKGWIWADMTAEKYYETNNCQGCGKIVAGSDKHVDHCHETLEVRGILCSRCNRGLGNLDDNPKTLLNLYHYINDRE